MKFLVPLLYLITLMFSCNSYAEKIIYQTSDIREAIKKVRPIWKNRTPNPEIEADLREQDAKRIQEKVWANKKLTSKEEDTLRKYSFDQFDNRELRDEYSCPDCPKIAKLTGEVNKILQKLGQKSKSPELKTKVGELEAMYYVFKDTNHPERNCRKNMGMWEYTKDYDVRDMNMTLIFDKKVDLKDIAALQLRKGEQRTYFYRGSFEQKNIWVRVIVDGDKANVSYFKLGKLQTAMTVEEKTLGHLKQEEIKKKEKEYSGYYTGIDSPGKEDSFKLNMGLMYQLDSHNLPKKVRILDMQSKDKFDWGETQVNMVVGTDTQEIDMGVNVDGAQHKLSVKSHNGKDFETTLSSKVNFINSYKLSGQIGMKGDTFNGRYELLEPSGNTMYISNSVDKKSSTNRVELGRTMHLGKGSLLAIKLRHDGTKPGSGNSTWLYYSTKF